MKMTLTSQSTKFVRFDSLYIVYQSSSSSSVFSHPSFLRSSSTNSVHVSSTIIHNEALSSGFVVRPLLPALGFSLSSLSLSLTVFPFLPFLASSSRFFCQLFALLCAFLLSKSATKSLQCWGVFFFPSRSLGAFVFSPRAGFFQM